MVSSTTSTVFFLSFCFINLLSSFAAVVSHDGRAITIDGERRILISGSIHYPRSTAEMWPGLIEKAKEGGLDAVETYVFWNAHEPKRRQYDFTGNLDLVRFIKTIQDAGLYAVLRIGPYVCAEWNYGGFPIWLHNMPGIKFRTFNSVFMDEMQNFTTLIVNMMKEEKLFASQGGPIILAQIENEYGNVISSYGDAGKTYMNWCASMANSLDIGVPWIMCKESDAPNSVINTCNGFYCDQFTPNNPNSPKMWTENWTGWFKNWGGKDPYRTAEDLAFAVARFFENGGTFQNYYMYHGGTNFGRTAGGPYITTTYDYDAPINEYGSLNQPKYGHLKKLHDVLHSMEKILTYGDVISMDYGSYNYANMYTYNGTSSCFLGNANSTNDAVIPINGVEHNVPAWSVSILPDCKTEVYNTAKVNTQTSVKAMISSDEEDESKGLEWTWRPEVVDDTVVLGKGLLSTFGLIDQKVINDASDYLWYMASVYIDKGDPVNTDEVTIRVNGTGQVIHAFVNGEFVGSQWAGYNVFHYDFEKKIQLKHGKNQITLLSATVGYENYGGGFDMTPTGLPGPVVIVGMSWDETIIKEMTAEQWSYKIGIDGIENQLFKSDSKSSSQWQSGVLPVNRTFTWYKTSFKAPIGNDPVALDLQGLGKGVAWVNGNNLGRYWPSYIAEDGCSTEACDYRGSFWSGKCATNCGQPTQRWYHVPRSFLNEDNNDLVLFEEFGGNPSLVSIKTVRPGQVCGNAYENNTMELSCEGKAISEVKFASFGHVLGACGSSIKGSCEGANDALSIIQQACVGNESCSVLASESVFGATGCDSAVSKRLVVEAVC